jgi:hypothetical protein
MSAEKPTSPIISRIYSKGINLTVIEVDGQLWNLPIRIGVFKSFWADATPYKGSRAMLEECSRTFVMCLRACQFPIAEEYQGTGLALHETN